MQKKKQLPFDRGCFFLYVKHLIDTCYYFLYD